MRKYKGITLIALVVTVIILLILAGVTVGLATNGTGLFEKAKLATDEYNNSVEKENDKLDNYKSLIDNSRESDLQTQINELRARLDKLDNWEKVGTVTITNGSGEINISKQYKKIKIYIDDTVVNKIPIESTSFEPNDENSTIAGGIGFIYKNVNNGIPYITYYVATQTSSKITFTRAGYDPAYNTSATLRTFTTDVYGIPE